MPDRIDICASPAAAAFVRSGMAMAIGLFGDTGELLAGNAGIIALTGGEAPTQPRADYLVNPDFARIGASTDAPLFEGRLTFADEQRQHNRSLLARIERVPEGILVCAEYDARELDQVHEELVHLNQQATNLQRALMKNNRQLEQAMDDLRRTQAMLIQSEKMNAMGQLVAGVAHEINNPLGFVMANVHSIEENTRDLDAGFGDLQALAEQQGLAEEAAQVYERHGIGYAREDAEDLFRATRDGLGRIQGIVENLRTFSRLHEAERKRVDLRENLDSTLALARPTLQEKAIEVVLELADLPPVECYPAELNQVFMNLIINAVQAMEPGGQLRICGSARDQGQEKVELSFTDSGCGIPADTCARVFDPFFTTKPVGGGTGLGLSIAHEIVVDHHGGELRVRSSPGEGATFTVVLPARLETSPI